MPASKYNREYVDKKIEEIGLVIAVTLPKKTNRETKIKCVCNKDNCQENFERSIRDIVEHNRVYCKSCTKDERELRKRKTCMERRGVENPSQSEEVKAKKKETNIERRGVENPFQCPEVKAKMKETNIERRGVEYPLQCPEVKAKTKETNIQRYGVENPSQSKEVKAKIKETNMERRGVEHPSYSAEVKEKRRQTSMKNHGVSHPFQSPEIFQKAVKSSFKRKEYEFPSGKIVTVQGYEPQALDILIKQEYNEDDIITAQTDVPEIWYETDDEKTHRYYVDIYIKSENRMIEVKSRYTYDNKKEVNHLKQQASKDAGYKHEIWIMLGNGDIEETI